LFAVRPGGVEIGLEVELDSSAVVHAVLGRGLMDEFKLKSFWKVLEGYANEALEVLPTVAFALAVVVGFFALARLVERVARDLAGRVTDDANLRSLAATISRITTIVVGLFAAATIVFPGLQVGDLVGVLGLSSVAVGFAFKDIFQNFLAGVLILVRSPFAIGDQIDTGSMEGTVKDIDIRATTLQTYDGRRVLIPNSDVYTSALTVNTAEPTRRSTFAAGIGYGEDIDRARGVILGAVEGCEGVESSPAPQVVVVEHGGSSVNFDVRYWHGSDKATEVAVRDRVATAIKYALDDAGIEIPFPYRTVEFFDKTDYNALLSGIDAENIVALPRRPAALTRPQEEAAGE
jgi:small-conductance mechanosensitive channel